jgi:hypothetical protein
MEYKVLSQINESVQQANEYQALVERTINVLEFDRSAVLATEGETEAFITKALSRPRLQTKNLLEDERAGVARAGEMDWMRQAEQHRTQPDTERKLGIQRPDIRPDKGQRVVMVGRGGIGMIVATDPEGKQVMVRDKEGREFVVSHDELRGPKMVGKEPTWMIAK